jgi:hypothetical protein
MKKVLSTALSIFLMLSVVIQTSIVYAEEGKTGSEYYLSDLKWVSASHGDYDTTKEVQKIIHLHRETMVRIRKSVLQWKMVQHAHLKKV